jgi:predicted phosphodiesterase
MRYAVISDVHSNLDALEAVFSDIDRRQIREIIFLGDAVGYGPEPNECIELLSARCKTLLAGNHDWGAVGLIDISCFNEYAKHAIEWTAEVITDTNKATLNAFRLSEEKKEEDAFFVHATPKEPGEWHYLLTLRDAELNFNYFGNKICFIGHSHQPFMIEQMLSGKLVVSKDKVQMNRDSRYIINAGSVGQPRDGDPRAGYAILDDDCVEIVRISYNIENVQDKMRQEDLPYHLIERLALGR